MGTHSGVSSGTKTCSSSGVGIRVTVSVAEALTSGGMGTHSGVSSGTKTGSSSGV